MLSDRAREIFLDVLAVLILVLVFVGFAVLLWPCAEDGDQAAAVPSAAAPGPPVPQPVLSVGPGEALGDEAYVRGFRLGTGWKLVKSPEGGFNFIGRITNEGETEGTARIIVKIYSGERIIAHIMCRRSLLPDESRDLICADTMKRDYTGHWNRLSLFSV